MKLFLSVALTILIIANLSGTALGEVISNDQADATFVMTNFFVHDNSFVSSQEAIKLTELLQFNLMGKTSYDWVSRDKINEIIKELKISEMGLAKNSSSLKIGRLTRADISLKGDILRQQDHSWLLAIEFIDLKHADIISKVEIPLPGRENMSFSFEHDAPLITGNKIVQALKHAVEELRKLNSKSRVAPLFFQNKKPGGRLDFFETQIAQAFANSENQNVKFIQFPRATESTQEAELVISGLVESDPDSWQKVADYYVWGEFEEIKSSGIPFDQVNVKATITVWDGFRRPEIFTEIGNVAKLERLSSSIVEKVSQMSQTKPRRSPRPYIRTKIASDLKERAWEMQEFIIQTEYENHPKISDTWWKRRNYAIRLLSVASFFDPTNEDIRTRLLVEQTRSDLTGLIRVRGTTFWRTYYRAIAWKEHCEKFGFNYQHQRVHGLKPGGAIGDNRISRIQSAEMYLYSLEQLLERFEYIFRASKYKAYKVTGSMNSRGNIKIDELKKNEVFSSYNILEDLPFEVLLECYDELCEEYCFRINKIAAECPQKIEVTAGDYLLAMLKRRGDSKLKLQTIEALWEDAKKDATIWHAKKIVDKEVLEIYSKEGNLERGKELLAMLPQEDVRQVTKMPFGGTYTTTKPHIVEKYGRKTAVKNKVPKEGYDSSGDKIYKKVDYSKSKTGKISHSTIPIREAEHSPVSLKNSYSLQGTNAMAYTRAYSTQLLWIDARGAKLSRNDFTQGSFLFLHDAKSNRLASFASRLGTLSKITSMLPVSGTLWMTFSTDGVWAMNTGSMKIKKYGPKDGLTSNEMHCSSVYRNKIFFGGGREHFASLCSIDKITKQWVGYDLPETADTNNGVYPQITEMASNNKWLAIYSSFGDAWTHVLLYNVAENKWLEIGKKLLSEEPGFCNFAKGERLQVRGLDIDANGLWITSTRGIALFDLKTMEYEYKCLSIKKITSSCFDQQYIWVSRVNTPFNRSSGSAEQDCHVLCFDRKTNKWLYEIPVPYKGRVEKMTKSKDALWLGMSTSDPILISISLTADNALGRANDRR